MGDKLIKDFFPEDLPWLTSDEKYLDGVELGAVLMILTFKAIVVSVKIRSINEEQLRVAAPMMGYHMSVDQRSHDWAQLTFQLRDAPTQWSMPG